MPGDSFFDSDNDGKLTGFETAMRDAYHLEMIDRVNQEPKSKREDDKPLAHCNDFAYIHIDKDNKEHPKQQTGSGRTIFACFLVILVVIIAFVIALSTENDFIRIMSMFGSVGMGVIILKAFRLMI